MPDEIKINRPAAGRREIRVFISSTFRDMQEEREELVKQIFPQLRRLCESRGVTWGEVDLRWGVPDEAKAEGKVLPLCLQEIEHCRPYFIGLLGERYGWVPEAIPESLFETQPWLREHLHQSVTALEILHGVLRNPEMAEHAFFYFRDPAYAAARRGFRERNPALRKQLATLKDEIRRSSFPVEEPFVTPKQLGEWVLRDLTAVIERLYPETEPPNQLDRAALDHEAYSASRRRVYIGRQEYVVRLDDHAAGDGPPLVITGESGGGKSALLANWTHDWSEQNPETPVLVHFIGAAPDSANWMVMLRRLLGEFQRKFGIQIEIPDQPDALRMAFANALHMVAALGRLVLALDALNQIEDRDGAPDLVWLPPVIPANVRLVVSTLPGRPWEDLKKREWPVLNVEPLTAPERETLIVRYLKDRYGKELEVPRRNHIADAPQTGNCLYLSTLLNELRQFGSHDDLEERIDWYLQATTPVELYQKVIQRWEEDYGRRDQASGDAPSDGLLSRILRIFRAKPKPAERSVVRESLSQLWAARRGLSEAELLDSLGVAGKPLPRAVWSPLYLAAGDALVNRSGLLNFAHDFLREAVRVAYLPTEPHKQAAHRTLATYFETQREGPRQLDELPWQLDQAGEWEHLKELLTNEKFFDAAWSMDSFELKTHWARLEANSDYSLPEAYRETIASPDRHDPNHVWSVAILLNDSGYLKEALHLATHVVKYTQSHSDKKAVATALESLAAVLQLCDEADQAMRLHKEAETFFREVNDQEGLARCLGNQAVIRSGKCQYEEAMRLHKDEEDLCRHIKDYDGLQRSLGNQALVKQAQGDLQGAISLFSRQEHLCVETGNTQGLAYSLSGQGIVLMHQGRYLEALKLQESAEEVFRGLGNRHGTAVTLGNRALLSRRLGNANEALRLFVQQASLCRELDNKAGLATSLGNQGMICCELENYEQALSLHREEEAICLELGDISGAQASRINQGAVLQKTGDLDGAMVLYQGAEEAYERLNIPQGLARALENQAWIWGLERNESSKALALAGRAYDIASRAGYVADAAGIQSLIARIKAKQNQTQAQSATISQQSSCDDSSQQHSNTLRRSISSSDEQSGVTDTD
jgi:tetratricopeptide (TPR) repeat protein